MKNNTHTHYTLYGEKNGYGQFLDFLIGFVSVSNKQKAQQHQLY